MLEIDALIAQQQQAKKIFDTAKTTNKAHI